MPFVAAGSEHPLATHAAGEVIGAALESVGHGPDLAVILVTGAFGGAIDDIADAVQRILSPRALIGSTTASVIVGDREIEERGAVALYAAKWNGDLSDGAGGPRTVAFDPAGAGDRWEHKVADQLTDAEGTLLLLGSGGSFPASRFVEMMAEQNPKLQVVGGRAAAASVLGTDALVADDRRLDGGAVGVLIPEGAPVRTFTSQGFRPVDDTFVVTRSHGNFIDEIAGRPALEHITELATRVSDEDRRAMTHQLLIGLVSEPSPGLDAIEDVLVRPLLGAERRTGAVVLDRTVPVGSLVRLGVRDAAAAADDLAEVLSGVSAASALVFTDVGRGRGLFGEANRDTGLVAGHVDARAVAGPFCTMEFGPVAGRTHVHEGSVTGLLFDGDGKR